MKTRNIFLLIIFILLSGYVFSQDLTGVKIFINPGHGGWDSDDRGIPTPLFPQVGPNVGFWESQSNLDKGLQLWDMLEPLGAELQISRTQNRTEDDLNLSVIVRMANEFQSDFMLSIHSNAGAGTANYVLMLYAGKDVNDTHTYATPTPCSDESRAISTLIAQNIITNQLTNWSTPNYNVSGDKTFGRLQMHWSDGYGVLRGLTVPGVISEPSMHDYIPETYRLMNMEYKWLEAWNFKKAFCTYFAEAEIPTGNIAGWVKDSRILIQDGTYFKRGKDVLLPLDGATVTILETGETYTVDNMRNGVYVFKDLDPGQYTVRAEADGYYAQEQEVVVVKNEIAYFNFELNKVRNTPPEVISFSPNIPLDEEVECSINIVFEFNWDMDEESVRNAFSMTPDVEGEITFEDSQYRMRFTPKYPLEKSTLYTVTLNQSASHPDNISMVEDFTFQFMTKDRNRLTFLGSYPANGNTGVYADKPLFWFIFDKKLTTSNLRDNINIYDKDGVAMVKVPRSISNNNVPSPYGSFYFEIADTALTTGEEYRILIGGDVMDDVGVKLVEPVEIYFTASSVKVSDKSIIEEFEVSGLYAYDAGQSLAVTSSSVARNTSQKLFGSASYRLRSTFTDDNAYVTYKVENPTITVNNENVIGLHIYGNFSGNELQLQLTAGSDVQYVKLCDLNFIGWEFAETKLSSLAYDTEYQLTGIRVVRNEGILSGSLDIYLDNMLLYDELISSLPQTIVSDIIIYPNPATDIINVQIQSSNVPVLQLYSVNGILLKEIKSDKIDVSNINQGTYILKIISGKEIVTRPVIIK